MALALPAAGMGPACPGMVTTAAGPGICCALPPAPASAGTIPTWPSAAALGNPGADAAGVAAGPEGGARGADAVGAGSCATGGGVCSCSEAWQSAGRQAAGTYMKPGGSWLFRACAWAGCTWISRSNCATQHGASSPVLHAIRRGAGIRSGNKRGRAFDVRVKGSMPI